MRVLVACEESQAVTIEFRKLGHEAAAIAKQYSAFIESGLSLAEWENRLV